MKISINENNGKILSVLYESTTIRLLNFKTYPSINYFGFVVNNIIETNETTDFLIISPYYENYKLKDRVKLEKYKLYIECHSTISEKDYEVFSDIHCKENSNFQRYYLCASNDHQTFAKILLDYKKYIASVREEMLDVLVSEFNLQKTDLVYGNFCFGFEWK